MYVCIYIYMYMCICIALGDGAATRFGFFGDAELKNAAPDWFKGALCAYVILRTFL